MQDIRMQRDLYERLLAVSLNKKIDHEEVLSFSLNLAHLPLCHLGGSICNTDNSMLLKSLENEIIEINKRLPSYINLNEINGFFLHILRDIPLTLGKIYKVIFEAILR